MKELLIVIPARYESSRFPGKPLCDIAGQSMIERVWNQCKKTGIDLDNIVVATDSIKIMNHCKDKDINVIQTSEECLTGTDRISEVSKKIEANFYINVQGDEPLIEPEDILLIIDEYKKHDSKVICAMTDITNDNDFRNPSIPKVVVTNSNKLLYISRAAIPTSKKLEFKEAKKQVCIYAFSKQSLKHYGLDSIKTPIEEIEDIEILRLLELDQEVYMVNVSSSSIAVDFPEDVQKVLNSLNG